MYHRVDGVERDERRGGDRAAAPGVEQLYNMYTYRV